MIKEKKTFLTILRSDLKHCLKTFVSHKILTNLDKSFSGINSHADVLKSRKNCWKLEEELVE